MISGKFKFDSVFHPGYCYLHLEDCDSGFILGMFHSACIRKITDDVVRARLDISTNENMDLDTSGDEEDELAEESPGRVFPSRVRRKPSLFANSAYSAGPAVRNISDCAESAGPAVRNIRELVEEDSSSDESSEEEQIVQDIVLVTQDDPEEVDVVLPVEEEMSDDDSVEVLDLNSLGREARDHIFLPQDSKRRMLTQLEFDQLPDSSHVSFYCICCCGTFQNHTTKQMSSCDPTHLFCISCSLHYAHGSNKCAFCRKHFFGYIDTRRTNNN